jgi:hypothetical protein
VKNCGNQDFLLWRWLFHFHNFWMVENCLLSYFFFECLQIICTGDVKTIIIIWMWNIIAISLGIVFNFLKCEIFVTCEYVQRNCLCLLIWKIKIIGIKFYVMLFPSYLTIKIKNLLKMWIWKEIWGSNMCWINYGNFMIAYFYNSS